MQPDRNFPWKSVLLAPLGIPTLFSAALALSAPGQHPVPGFLVFLVLGSVVSYGATFFLLLPCLVVLSRLVPLTAGLTGAVGAALGSVVYVPVLWLAYRGSGKDSGPPEGTFMGYVWDQIFGWETLVLPAAGLITALLFWFLATPEFRNQPSARGIE